MTDFHHLSDADLRSAADGQATEVPRTHIEAHMAECVSCRTRLLDVIADATWRDELVGGLKDLGPARATSRAKRHALAPPARVVQPAPVPSGDPFDLETIERMLETVLKPVAGEPIEGVRGMLGRYQVECVLGCGGMGVVLRGFDLELSRPVAIKMILPRLAGRGVAKERFLREARAAATVIHPNVVSIHGIDEAEGVPWFLMPLIVGPSLRTLVEAEGPLDEQDILRIGVQIASGLAAAHAQGLVHRDIKPENILVDNQVNRVVITDFGLAQRECEEAMTQTGWVAGSLHYMSPEQSRGETVDGRSDLFSLGGVLYFLATGEAPFQSPTAMGVLHRIGSAKAGDVRGKNPQVSALLAGIIDRLLAKSPDDRFASAGEAESFFGECLAHLHQPGRGPAPVLPARRSLASWQIGAALAAVAALLVAGAGWGWGGLGRGGEPELREERPGNGMGSAGTPGATLEVPAPVMEAVREVPLSLEEVLPQREDR